jgi:ABC-type multidrug transport system ATPase subunit
MTSVIVTRQLTKRYGPTTVVDQVELDVHEGELFGFLGPNGSGKTTTIRMLLGLVFASHGTIELLGRPMPAATRDVLVEVGALVDGPGLYPAMSARRNLSLLDASGRGGARRTRRARIDDALELVGLANVGRLPTRAFSMGMKQRLALAAALVRQPRLLILDEPTNGLDPQGIQEMRTLFQALVAGGTTVFLSSHLLTEVEQLCTSAAMMAGGRVVAQDTMAALIAPTGRVVIDTPDTDDAIRILGDRGAVTVSSRHGDRLLVELRDRSSAEVNHELVRGGVRVRELTIERRTLEDTYLGLTGRSGDDSR